MCECVLPCLRVGKCVCKCVQAVWVCLITQHTEVFSQCWGGGFLFPSGWHGSVQSPHCYLSCNSSCWDCSRMLSEPNTSSVTYVCWVLCWWTASCSDSKVHGWAWQDTELGVWEYRSEVAWILSVRLDCKFSCSPENSSIHCHQKDHFSKLHDTVAD